MLDMTKLQTRSFDVKLTPNVTVSMKPPKIKVLRKIISAAKREEADSVLDAVTLLFSQNKNGKRLSREWLEEHMDLAEMRYILKQYFEWVNNIKNDPN